jgi:hypothetical protein
MKKLLLAALALLPLAAGCYVAPYPRAYYPRRGYVRVYGPPPPVVVAPPPPRVYW